MSILQTLQRISFEWGIRSFGNDHMHDFQIRGLRFAEEAVELAQCAQVPKETMHLLIETVYSRPRGEVRQEIGGSLVTLSVLCELLGYDMEQCFENEVRRVLSKSPEHFAKRNQDKIHLGLK